MQADSRVSRQRGDEPMAPLFKTIGTSCSPRAGMNRSEKIKGSPSTRRQTRRTLCKTETNGRNCPGDSP